MLERPFQNAMNDEVGIAPNGRSEMGVLVEAEGEMSERLRGVAGLVERTEHEVGGDAFFRFADDLSNEALIVLRNAPEVATRERHLHAALAAVAIGVRAAGFGGRWNTAMANGDFGLVQVFDDERVTESAGQLFELEDFARVGYFVNAMERIDAAAKEIRGDGAVGGEHEFFNEAVSDVALAARDVGHALLFVEFNDGLREIGVDGPVFVAAGGWEKGGVLHIAGRGGEPGGRAGPFPAPPHDSCVARCDAIA